MPRKLRAFATGAVAIALGLGVPVLTAAENPADVALTGAPVRSVEPASLGLVSSRRVADCSGAAGGLTAKSTPAALTALRCDRYSGLVRTGGIVVVDWD